MGKWLVDVQGFSELSMSRQAESYCKKLTSSLALVSDMDLLAAMDVESRPCCVASPEGPLQLKGASGMFHSPLPKISERGVEFKRVAFTTVWAV